MTSKFKQYTVVTSSPKKQDGIDLTKIQAVAEDSMARRMIDNAHYNAPADRPSRNRSNTPLFCYTDQDRKVKTSESPSDESNSQSSP